MINSMDSLMECLSEIDTIFYNNKEVVKNLILETDTLIIENKGLKERNLKLEERVNDNKKYIKISFLAGLGLGVLIVLL
jgi:regulator of replication initiation timing